jgi:SAM-dependent methyltransferase
MPSDVRDSIERGWRDVAAIDEALERGEIDEDEWVRRSQQLIVSAYLSAEPPWAQSGHSGPAPRWEVARRLILAAVHRPGTFLDVGCANGFLMETLHAWAAEDGIELEPYGLDLSPELAELARRRLPRWADRIFVGNALDWQPPRRFDFVRTGLEYVPATRRRELVAHLLSDVCDPRGRLIIGSFNEEREPRATEDGVASFGFAITGRVERDHDQDDRIVRRVFWIDAQG